MKRFRVAYYTSRNIRIDQNTSADEKKVFACEVVTVHTIYVWAGSASEALATASELKYVKALGRADQIRCEAVK